MTDMFDDPRASYVPEQTTELHNERPSESSGGTTPCPTITLNDGRALPVVCFGSGTVLSTKFCRDSRDYIVIALRGGYRALDVARDYSQAASIRLLLNKARLKREDVYVVAQCSSRKPSTFVAGFEDAARAWIKVLDLEYVDMFLLHGPGGFEPIVAWRVLEKLRAQGLTKSIGLSNFREEEIKALAPHWTVPPAINQMEFHPFVAHRPDVQRTLTAMREHRIVAQAYSALAPLHHVTDGPVAEVASKIAGARLVTPAQVLLAWARQVSGGGVVTTSCKEARQSEQLHSFKVDLTEAEVDEIAAAGQAEERNVCRLAGMWTPKGYTGP